MFVEVSNEWTKKMDFECLFVAAESLKSLNFSLSNCAQW